MRNLPHFEIQPVSLTEETEFPSCDVVLRELRLDPATLSAGDMALILAYQDAAVLAVENATDRKFLARTLDILFDYFPTAREPLRLPVSPMQSVESVSYFDSNGDVQIIPETDYYVTFGLTPRLQPVASWPMAQSRIGAVTVRVLSGIDTTADSDGVQPELSKLLADVQQAIILTIRSWWESRGSGVNPGMESETIGDYSYTRAKSDSTEKGIPARAMDLLAPHIRRAV